MIKKNYSKKLLLALALAMPFAAFSAEITYETEEEITYTLDDETMTAKLSKTGYSVAGEINIPAKLTYDGATYTVTSIASKAFSYRSKITKIILPNTITVLDERALSSCSATEYILPEGLKVIGKECFYFSDDFSSITIPASVDSIAEKAFYYTDVTAFHVSNPTPITLPSNCFDSSTQSDCNLYVPAGCVEAYSAAEVWCDFNSIAVACMQDGMSFVVDDATQTAALAGVLDVEGDTLVIPSTITSGDITYTVNEIAARGLSGTTFSTYEIPTSITKLGEYAFSECSNLETIALPNTIDTLPKGLFYSCKKLTSVDVPSSVTVYDSRVFGYCDALESFEIKENVTSIGSSLFASCKSLTSVSFPSTLVEMGYGIFDTCKALTSISVAAGNAAYSSEDGVLFNKDKSTILFFPQGRKEAYVMPNSVTVVEEDAFYKCDSIRSVQLSSNLDSIKTAAFSACVSLETVTFPSTLKYIGEDAFFICNSLKTANLPESVEFIGESAFFSCKALVSVTIPDSVKSIGSMAFMSCKKLKNVFVSRTTPLEDIADNAFNLSYDYATLYVPQGCVEAYEAAEGWNSFNSIQVAELAGKLIYTTDKTTQTATLTGAAQALDAALNVPETITDGEGNIYQVTTIADNAFVGETDIVSVTLPNSVKTIGVSAFSECSNLTQITFGDSITTIDDKAFYKCAALRHVDIPNTVELIGVSAFAYCSVLDVVTLPESLTYLGGGAFGYCTNMTVVNFPSAVETIDEQVFMGCTSLMRFYLTTDTPPVLPANTFSESTAPIATLYVPSGSEFNYLQDRVWSGFGTISTVTIIDKVGYVLNKIGKTATVTGYTDYVDGAITVPETIDGGYTVTAVSDYAFYRALNMTSVSLPNSITSIGQLAFAGCEEMTAINLPTSLVSIGKNAFAACYKVTAMDIPASLTTIADEVFYYCSSIQNYTVDAASEHFCAVDGVLYSKDMKALYAYPLAKTSETYDIPATVEEIKVSAFATSPYITSMTFPTSLKIIGGAAFSSCPELSYVSIPNSVDSIGMGAFFMCENMTELHVDIEEPFELEYQTFYHCYDGCTLYVPAGCVEAYEAKYFWTLFDFIVEDVNLAVEQTKAPLSAAKVRASNGMVTISNVAEGTPITIYSLMGSLVATKCADDQTVTIALPASGIYLVKVGDAVTKVAL